MTTPPHFASDDLYEARMEQKKQKKLKQAKSTIKYTWLSSLISLLLLAAELISWQRHPNVESALGILSPIGLLFVIGGELWKARNCLNGTRTLNHTPFLLLGSLLFVSSGALQNMHRHKEWALFQTLAIAVVILAIFCLFMLVWEVCDFVRTQKPKLKLDHEGRRFVIESADKEV